MAVQTPPDERFDEVYAKRLLITVLLAVIAFSSSMTIVSAVIGTMADYFGVSSSFMGWSVTGLFLAMAVGTPIMGRLGDVHGHRKIFLFGATTLAIATAGCGLAPNATAFIGFRVLAGVGISATMPTGMAMILAANPPQRRSEAMGWYTMVMTGAPVISLIIGGPLIDAFGWRTVFAMLTPVALMGLAASVKIIRPTEPGPPVPIDWLGAFCLGACTMSLLIGLERLAKNGPTGFNLTLLGGGLVFGALFFAVESTVEYPLLRLEYFRRRNFSGPLISQPLSQFAYMGGFIVTPLLLADVFGVGVAATALILTFRPGVYSVVSPMGGRATDRNGGRPMLAIGSVGMALSMVAFAMGAHFEQIGFIIGGLMLSGLAMGLASPAFTTIVAGSVDPADMGVANGMGSTVMNIGMLSGIQIMLVMLGDTREPSDFVRVFLFGGMIALFGLAGAAIVEPRPRASA